MRQVRKARNKKKRVDRAEGSLQKLSTHVVPVGRILVRSPRVSRCCLHDAGGVLLECLLGAPEASSGDEEGRRLGHLGRLCLLRTAHEGDAK